MQMGDSPFIQEVLTTGIARYLKSGRAKQMALRFCSEPDDAMGYLWLKLRQQWANCQDPLRNPETWILVNSRHHHQNFLRSELGPIQEDEIND